MNNNVEIHLPVAKYHNTSSILTHGVNGNGNTSATCTAETADDQFRITYIAMQLVPSETDTCGTKTICLS